MDYLRLLEVLVPDVIVLVTLFVARGFDYGKLKGATLEVRNRYVANIVSAGLILAVLVTFSQWQGGLIETIGEGQLVLNPLTLVFKCLLFGLTIIVVRFASSTSISEHVGEYYAMLLLATLGMGFLVTTRNLLLAFVALELVSLSLYALTAFRRNSPSSAEAAIKYFAFGGLASAFLLFGLSYIYGVTNSLHFESLALVEESSPLLFLGLLLVFVGLGFKVAVVPFHLWAPDVYQCAPTPVAGWVATGSKIASLFLLLSILKPVSENSALHVVVLPALSAIASASMLIGNLGALRQRNLKRLLAYSGIANMGYLLVGTVALTPDGFASSLFYVLIYSLANLGAFCVVGALCDHLGREAEIDDFKGCWQRSPALAFAFLFFFLSLAGIPPLAGFVGKYYLFFAAIGKGHQLGAGLGNGYYVLVGLALVMSVISLYYYVRVLKAFLVAEGESDCSPKLDSMQLCLVYTLVGAVLFLGVFPGIAIDFLKATAAF